MPNKKITSLTALGAAPSTTDLIPLVDVSDTTDSANGTTKKVTVANLFTAPTVSDFTNANHDHSDADDGGQLTDAALSSAIGIAKGGTGQTSQTAAFDALAPTTTQGDTIYHNGSDNIRLAKGTAGQYYRMNSGGTTPEWSTPVFSFQQSIPIDNLTSTPTSSFATGSSSDGSAIFIQFNDDVLARYGRDSNTGMYTLTHSVNPSAVVPGSDSGCIVQLGVYIYIFSNNGTNIIATRFLAADLTGEQAMTVPTVGCTDYVTAWTDGTDVYVVSNATNTTSRRWSVSGTTFSAVSTATCVNSLANVINRSTVSDGVNNYVVKYSSGIFTVLKLSDINGSAVTTTSYTIGEFAPSNTSMSVSSSIDSTKMYVGNIFAIFNQTDTYATRIGIVPVTKP